MLESTLAGAHVALNDVHVRGCADGEPHVAAIAAAAVRHMLRSSCAKMPEQCQQAGCHGG